MWPFTVKFQCYLFKMLFWVFRSIEIDIWGLMGFRVAHQSALDERRSRVIIIIKGDIGPIENLQSELKAYLKTNIYFRWDNKKEKQFFNKLRLAIAHPKYFKADRNSNTIEIV